MSASDRDREAALALLDVLRRCGTGVNSKRVDRIAEAIATARTEARREAFSEAAEMAHQFRASDYSVTRAALDSFAAVLRAKAGEEQR